MIAALFVETGGCYFGLSGVEPWDEARDALRYNGPHPIVAHPPCQRWGRYWHGSPRKPHQYELGDDGGCFASALNFARHWGGVIEHPAGSHAWPHFDLRKPSAKGGWRLADIHGGLTCCVEQGHYGHFARKRTWLYFNAGERWQFLNRNEYSRVIFPQDLIWGPSEQRLPAYAVERYGYEKARRIGIMAAVGGKDKTKTRNATPPAFRDVLLSIARATR